MSINDYDEKFRRRFPRFSGVKSLTIFYEMKKVELLDISEKGMRISYNEAGIFLQDAPARFNIIMTEKGRPVGHELYVRCTWVDHPEYGFVFGSNSIGVHIWRSIYSENEPKQVNAINGTEY